MSQIVIARAVAGSVSMVRATRWWSPRWLSLWLTLFSSLIVPFAAGQDGDGPVTTVKQPVWVIAHMTNSAAAVDFAGRSGANGIEVDLNFDAQGNPISFTHGSPCDCSCMHYGVCLHLGTFPCSSAMGVDPLFDKVTQWQQIGLVVIDSKVTTTTNPDAATKVVRAMERLFNRGYRGVVIIGAPKLSDARYVQVASQVASTSPYRDRMFFTIDGEGAKTREVLDRLVELQIPNRVYGTGISACSPTQYYGSTLLGEVNRRAGVIGFNYIWTIDKPETAATYLEKGAGGIMTNNPEGIVQQVRALGYTLAATGTVFPRAVNTVVQTQVPSCDCNYSPGGCRISRAVQAGWACKCEYKGAWTCGGTPVVCQDPGSAACQRPSDSFESCLQGRGDCQGYKDVKCDCDYRKGGCIISRPAPPNAACKCIYKGAWTCGGAIVPCRDWNSQACRAPSGDKASCLEGGGDCGGYPR